MTKSEDSKKSEDKVGTLVGAAHNSRGIVGAREKTVKIDPKIEDE